MFTNYDNAYDFDLETNENEYFKLYNSKFEVANGDVIAVDFAGDKDTEEWHFGFSRVSEDEVSQNLTGTGDAIKILSTVIKMIIHVALVEDVRFMMFRAEDEGVRGRLFEKIFRKLSPEYGYGVKVQTSESGSTISVIKGAVYETA